MRHGQALSGFASANHLIVGISVAVTQGAPVFVAARSDSCNRLVIYDLAVVMSRLRRENIVVFFGAWVGVGGALVLTGLYMRLLRSRAAIRALRD
ncbi:hypothetical protein IX84_00855 [Phaeodactylibacter xiamenensis]|uniref:Uncharacterized protein n=1 Tax=Phaeodactylibacter xiamenensis TaxID=1524460 RepID=A0A098SBU8_9BACT|nr:hypothetical protein IX84_00855 [Phaeodactylibacter xiamenensis]